MVRRKKVSTSSRDGTKPKLLTWTKIRRTLEELDWDTQKFIKTYESLGRVEAGPRKPDAKLLKAGKEFDAKGDVAAFQKAIGAKTVQQAYTRLGRYQAYKVRAEANA